MQSIDMNMEPYDQSTNISNSIDMNGENPGFSPARMRKERRRRERNRNLPVVSNSTIGPKEPSFSMDVSVEGDRELGINDDDYIEVEKQSMNVNEGNTSKNGFNMEMDISPSIQEKSTKISMDMNVQKPQTPVNMNVNVNVNVNLNHSTNTINNSSFKKEVQQEVKRKFIPKYVNPNAKMIMPGMGGEKVVLRKTNFNTKFRSASPVMKMRGTHRRTESHNPNLRPISTRTPKMSPQMRNTKKISSNRLSMPPKILNQPPQNEKTPKYLNPKMRMIMPQQGRSNLRNPNKRTQSVDFDEKIDNQPKKIDMNFPSPMAASIRNDFKRQTVAGIKFDINDFKKPVEKKPEPPKEVMIQYGTETPFKKRVIIMEFSMEKPPDYVEQRIGTREKSKTRLGFNKRPERKDKRKRKGKATLKTFFRKLFLLK